VTQNVTQDGRQAEFRSARRRSMPVEREKTAGRLNQRLEMLAVIALATIYLLWFAWPLWWSASENVRLVGTFNTDEEAHVMLLKEAIDNRSLRLGYIQYGYAYLNMGLLPLLLLSFLADVTEQQIIVWLRMIPTLFALATVALTFWMARRCFGRLAAWLSAFLLSFTVLNFLRMSVMSHSDIPQVFFLMMGMYFCCRLAEDGHSTWLISASVAAGFAFGCKYTGLFLLPIIGLYAILRTIQLDTAQLSVNSDQVVRLARLLSTLVGVGLLILGSVIIPYAAAPYVGAEYFGVPIPQFLNSLRVMSIVAAAGLVLLTVVPPIWSSVRRRPKLVYLIKLGMLAAITFALAFFVTSPFNVFSLRSGFWRGFLYESLHSSFGHGFGAQSDRLEWFSILSSPELLNPLILALSLVSLALTAHEVAKRGWQGLFAPESVMWVWTLCYFSFLVWRVNLRTHRALLPIVPFLLILAARAVSQLIPHAATRRSRRLGAALTVAGLLIIVGLALPKSLDRMLEFRQSTSSREQSSEAVVAGHWLAAHYPPPTRVLYDPYSYVPPVFADAHVTPWGGTLQMLETLEPDVVIVNSYSSGRFSDVRQAATYARDEAQFMARHQYYATLRGGGTGYVLVRDFGSVQVYERQED
jgi:hypothetical protein